jgi:hypothetical protein
MGEIERTVYHVVLDTASGEWIVRKEGDSRNSGAYARQASAVRAAIYLAKKRPPGRVKIHGEDGTVLREHTYE